MGWCLSLSLFPAIWSVMAQFSKTPFIIMCLLFQVSEFFFVIFLKTSVLKHALSMKLVRHPCTDFPRIHWHLRRIDNAYNFSSFFLFPTKFFPRFPGIRLSFWMLLLLIHCMFGFRCHIFHPVLNTSQICKAVELYLWPYIISPCSFS